MQTFSQRLEQLSEGVAPSVITLLTVLLAAIPLRVPGLEVLLPSLALINIFYWCVFYPDVLPYWFLFALGLLEDTLKGTPLGISSAMYMSFAFLLARERQNFGQLVFESAWLAFIVLSFVVLLVEWIILSIYWGQLLAMEGPLLQWAATCLAYPFMHVGLTRLYRLLVRT